MGRRYVVRDSETKKPLVRNGIKIEFVSYVPAMEYVKSMSFSLGYYYEVWDSVEDKVIFTYDVVKGVRIWDPKHSVKDVEGSFKWVL